MPRTGPDWAFSLLWVNFAVAVVVLIQLTGNQTASMEELARVLAYALVYGNLSGILAILIVGILADQPSHRRLPRAALVLGSSVLSSVVGCMLAQVLLMAVRVAVPRQFWREYFHTLLVGIPLALVFGSAALVHASLKARAQAVEAKLREKEASEERTRELLAEARLHSLESRIHPHFLFNTLNSISSLIAVDPGRAEHIVERLAVLLRASLDTATQPLIPLRQELALVESYLEIQEVRFGDKLRGVVTVPVALHESKVPPMSVQALVENAVKHGIAPLSGGGEVLVSASADNDTLRIEIRDSGPGFDLTAIHAGHGLDNLVARLDALFGAQARLNVYRQSGYCLAEIVLPLT